HLRACGSFIHGWSPYQNFYRQIRLLSVGGLALLALLSLLSLLSLNLCILVCVGVPLCTFKSLRLFHSRAFALSKLP
ncbi:hypothetical protein AALC25_10330, partial [Lachnospiraceae bacterium 29-84]